MNTLDELELIRSQARRVRREANLLVTMVARAIDAAAALTDDSPKEDTRNNDDSNRSASTDQE